MREELTRLYPTLMRVVDTPALAADLEKARSCFDTGEPVDCIHEKRVAGEFQSGLMTYHLAAALARDGWFDPLVPLIEADLERLAGRVGKFDELISAFRRKLLNDAEFDDVVYEIAAAAVFSDLLDGNRVSLEEPLNKSTKKNPDVTGSWGGRRTRAEVTVVHDDWPPAYSHEAKQVIEGASVPGGYTVTLNVPLTATTDAEGIRGLIEGLFNARLTSEVRVKIGGYEFSHRNNEFRSSSVQCPIHYVEFHDLDFRDVQGSCVERSTITQIEQYEVDEQFPKPKGVVTTADLEKNATAYSDSPIGEKIYRTLEKKMLKQCEPGAVNVIVLGLPQQHNDRGVMDALQGSGVTLVPLLEPDGSSTRETPAVYARTGLAPFVDLSRLPPERAAALQGEVDRFKKVSAILVLRLYAGNPLAAVIPNPHADRPLTPDEREALRRVALERASRSGNRPEPNRTS